MNIMLSVIIPVYNTPMQKLKDCISSVREIKGVTYEILLINDGSGREYTEEYEKFTENIPEIRYYHQENGGVSKARNVGIDYAKGEYVMFVDADDQIIAGRIDRNIFVNSPSLIIFDYYIQINGKKRLHKSLCEEADVRRACLLETLLTTKKMNAVCAKIVRKEMLDLNAIRFDFSMVSGEDKLFNLNVARKAGQVRYLAKPVYVYIRDIHTTEERLKKHCDRIYENHEKLLQEEGCIMEELSGPQREAVRRKLCVREANWLYGYASGLARQGLLTEERKKSIESAIGRFPVTKETKKEYLQYKAVKDGHWLLIRGLAGIRRAYQIICGRM